MLGRYTRQGLRVLALAARPLPGVTLTELASLVQEELEAGLGFMGLAVMVNPLRPDTAQVLAELQAAGIRTVMVTGDHARTAVSVGQQCGMLGRRRKVVYVDAARAEGRVEDSALSVGAAGADGGVWSAARGGEGAEALLAEVARGAASAAVTGRGFQRVSTWFVWGGGLERSGVG